MKVYFEITGWGNDGTNKLQYITAFVNPTDDGYGYHYDMEGKLWQFAWCHKESAKCVEHTELPKEMWYSIRHGVHDFQQITDKKHIGNADIDIPNLKYTKVERKQVALFKKVLSHADSINSIEELKAFYPEIKGLQYIPVNFAKKVLSLIGWLPYPVTNGELGMASFQTGIFYSQALKSLGLE